MREYRSDNEPEISGTVSGYALVSVLELRLPGFFNLPVNFTQNLWAMTSRMMLVTSHFHVNASC